MRPLQPVQSLVWVLEMSAEEVVENETDIKDLKFHLLRMIYNQPTILFYVFEVLFELLEVRGVMNEEEAKALITEALKRWRDEGGEI